MTKKYYSSDEFYTIDSNGKKKSYSGYVLIKDGAAYAYNSDIKLIPADGYNTTINLSDSYFDRNLDKKLKLPNNLVDCTFGANDYLKSSVLKRIIKNLDENNRYIYKNCLVSRNDLPVASIIPALGPWRKVSQKTITITNPDTNETKNLSSLTTGDVEGWGWSNISYNYINNINEKSGIIENPFADREDSTEVSTWTWPDTVWGHDWNTYDIVDSAVALTDKTDNNGNQLYAVFLAEKTKIRIFNIYLFPDDKLSQYSDPLINLSSESDASLITTEVEKRKFDTNNFNIALIDKIDPQNELSFNFKSISGIKISGNFLYVVDSELNGIFKYDISRCLTDRGADVSNQILLVNKLYGLGDLNTPYFFNNPISISAENGIVAVLDRNNICVKVFDIDFNHLYTIRHGSFVRQNPKLIQICPYEFKLNSISVKAGAIFVISEVSNKISIDVFNSNGEYIGNKEIKYVTLEENEYNDVLSTIISGKLIAQEELIKVEFSVNDSNLYYIITNRRIIKLYLSDLVEPIGVSSLINKIIDGEVTYGITWLEVNKPWATAVMDSGQAIIWGNATSTYPLTYPFNHCFSICFNPNINGDIIFTISNNTIHFDGIDNTLIHRVDNWTDKKKMYIKEDGSLTYSATNIDGSYNTPVTVKPGDMVNEYKSSETDTSVPDTTGNTFIYEITDSYKRTYNTILFYREPNEYKSLLIRPDIKLYTLDEISAAVADEYVSQVSLNKLLFKILFNLNEIKQYICGTFTAGYSVENIMTYDSISLDYSISTADIPVENFIFGENERVSIVLNRCFENIYKAQVNILDKIQTKFISSTNYNLHAFKSI